MSSQKFFVKQIPKENRNQKVWSRRAYVDWVNKTLKSHYTNMSEFRNGALYVQLFDSLFPGVISLEGVRFSAQKEYDCYHNFCILDEAFRRLGIDKNFDAQALSEGRHVESWEFLKWFKLFYDQNYVEKDYEPLSARRNAYMGFGRNRSAVKSELVKKISSQSARIVKVAHSKHKSLKRKLITKCDKSETSQERPAKEKKSMQLVRSLTDKLRTNVKPVKKLNEKKGEEVGKSHSLDSVKTLTETKSRTGSTESRKSSARTVILKYEPSNDDIQLPESPNVHSIVFDKTATYDEFKINISDNIQIRFENINSPDMKRTLSNPENRRKINLMVEKFLESQWVERRDYLDNIVDFLRGGEKN